MTQLQVEIKDNDDDVNVTNGKDLFVSTPTTDNEEDDDVEEEDDSYYDEDDDDDDDDDLSISSILQKHWVALVVALIAACVSHYIKSTVIDTMPSRQSKTTMTTTSSSSSSRRYSDDMKKYGIGRRHDHLNQFIRMANISFCQISHSEEDDTVVVTTTRNTKNTLEQMDFYIPYSLLPTLQLLYLADTMEYDFYHDMPLDAKRTILLNNNNNNEDNNNEWTSKITTTNNQEYKCLMEQVKHNNKISKELPIHGTTFYYKSPTINDIYKFDDDDDDESTMTSVTTTNNDVLSSRKRSLLSQPHMTFTGFGAKFINRSPNPVLLYWDGKGGHDDAKKLVGEIPPMESLGTATQPGQSFHISPIYDPSTALQRWIVTADTAVLYYDPHKSADGNSVLDEYNNIKSIQRKLDDISNNNDNDNDNDTKIKKQNDILNLYIKYQLQLLNEAFGRDYLIASKRIWYSHFPRHFPSHPIHNADYIGQEHQVMDASLPTTTTTTTMDNKEEEGEKNHNDNKLTLKVVSVSPRVFTIDNFLTKEQCEEIIQQAKDFDEGLQQSTLVAGSKNKDQENGIVNKMKDLNTRSSTNAWLPRYVSNVTELIYDKTAQVLKLNPSVFHDKYNYNNEGEEDDDFDENENDNDAKYHSIAESIQVVRYKPNGKDQYAPHHDFVSPTIGHRYQPTRFATVLIYLTTIHPNGGGETIFPRALNKDYAEGIKVHPKQGSAVLFYNMLPDGNVDDISQHGSEPLKMKKRKNDNNRGASKGGEEIQQQEKWIANVWVWDPVIN